MARSFIATMWIAVKSPTRTPRQSVLKRARTNLCLKSRRAAADGPPAPELSGPILSPSQACRQDANNALNLVLDGKLPFDSSQAISSTAVEGGNLLCFDNRL